MSTTRFYREHAASMRAGDVSDHSRRMQDAHEAVRDKWIAQKEYEALTTAILGNWTSGNCAEYMAPLSQALIAEGCMALHRHLWTRAIKRQVETFFREYSWIRQQRPTFAGLATLDTAGFDESDISSYTDHERAAAFLLQRLIKDLSQWRSELINAGVCASEPEHIHACPELLKLPKISVNKLPPNNSSKPTPLRGAA